MRRRCVLYGLVSGEWVDCVAELTAALGGSADVAASQLLCDVLSECAEEVWETQLPIGEDDRRRVQAPPHPAAALRAGPPPLHSARG